ncbi:MAG: IclR family transcriptional regulator [Desulfovibrio sp.]|jgi:DNA-binding IclR family transcriptional regulator|nr:IclR family transcriptional regulator [Desulfovibrio sp.]
MSNLINAVERALDVLLYINRVDGPVGVSQISKDLGMHKSTVFRTLATLESRRFVMQDPESGKYSLGVSLFSMSKKIGFYDVFKPFAQQLGQEFNEAVNVSVLERTPEGVYRSTIVVKEDSKANVLSVSPKVGTSMDCYCSSVGKCLLAFARDVDVQALEKYPFTRFTGKTIASPQELVEELGRVREAGYAMDDEEQEVGLTCVGVPIFNSEGHVVAAISISGPTPRIRSWDPDVLARRLREVAAEITTLL